MSALGEQDRPLGPCEVYSSSRHALGFYKCVANTCRYTVPETRLGNLPIRDVLEAAVSSVVLATASLSVGIAGQDTSTPWFVRLPSLNIRSHVEYVEKSGDDAQDSVLLRILERQHDQSWLDIEQRPPWKLIVVNQRAVPEDGRLVFDAVFAVHHAIADGRSTALFHTKLLSELSRLPPPPAQLSGGILEIPGDCKLLPPLEQLVPFSTPWTGKVIIREPCRTLLRLVTIPPAAVPSILAACRANTATLTSMLHALALASLSKHAAPEQAVGFTSSTPIDLRPFMGADVQQNGDRDLFGVYITGQFHDFDARTVTELRKGLSTARVWKIAADLRHSVKRHLGKVPKDDIMGMLGWVSDWPKFWLSKVGKPHESTWEVSNVGSMAGGHGTTEETGGGWRIQRSILSQGATVAGAAVNISVAGVAGCGIDIVLGWQEGTVENETVDGLAEDLQRWLDRLGHGQPDFI